MKNAEDILKEKGMDLIFVDESSTIEEALRKMVENKIGAILVKSGGKISGIWTERDLMRNTLLQGFDAGTAKIKDYMVTGLISAPANCSVYMLMDKFLGLRLRHLLIEKDGEYVGMLSTGDVIKATLNEKNKDLKELNAILSWEYYENWRWSNK
jgi:signal-transduction protein with cAMP-binding, CBS, and nucleotidyltransferase domain